MRPRRIALRGPDIRAAEFAEEIWEAGRITETTDRERLEQRRASLRSSLAGYQRELRTAHSLDAEESAVEAEGDEVLEALEDLALKEIGQIEAALRRIDLGI